MRLFFASNKINKQATLMEVKYVLTQSRKGDENIQYAVSLTMQAYDTEPTVKLL